jgi:hypothetical protein
MMREKTVLKLVSCALVVASGEGAAHDAGDEEC